MPRVTTDLALIENSPEANREPGRSRLRPRSPERPPGWRTTPIKWKLESTGSSLRTTEGVARDCDTLALLIASAAALIVIDFGIEIHAQLGTVYLEEEHAQRNTSTAAANCQLQRSRRIQDADLEIASACGSV